MIDQQIERALSVPLNMQLTHEQIDEWQALPERDRRLVTPDALARWTRGLTPDDYTLEEIARLEHQRSSALRTLRAGAELTDLEYRLIRFLQRHERRTCTYLDIARHLWDSAENRVTARLLAGHDGYAAPMIIHIHGLIYQIRRKLEIDPLRPQHLCNIRGVGYRWYAHPPALNDGENYDLRATESSVLRQQMREQLGIVEGDFIAVVQPESRHLSLHEPSD